VHSPLLLLASAQAIADAIPANAFFGAALISQAFS